MAINNLDLLKLNIERHNITDLNNTPHYLTIEELNTIKDIRIAGSSLSFIGSIFIMVAYLFMFIKVRCKDKNKVNPESETQKKFKNLKMGIGHDLIFLISISDFFNSIFQFFGIDMVKELFKVSPLCIAQGAMLNFFDTATLCCISLISLSILLGIYDIEVDKVKYIYLYYLIYVIGYSTLLTLG